MSGNILFILIMQFLREWFILSGELSIPPPVVEDHSKTSPSKKSRSLASNIIRYLILISISLAILFLLFWAIMHALWSSAFSSGCWGFPGEDCS